MLNGEGHSATIEEGAKSQFDVIANGAVVFSKQHEGRFPSTDEIVAALAR